MTSKSLRVLVSLFCLACMASSVVKAEDVLAEVDAQLRSALEQYSNSKKQIAITFSNSGYLNYCMNWLHHVRSVGVDNYVIFALDAEAYSSLKGEANVFYDPRLDEGKIDKRATDFGSDPFKKIVHLKPTLTLRVLELGFHLLLSDADVVWFKDPFSVPEVVGSHLNLMSDAHFDYAMGNTPYFVNSGFAYMSPHPTTIAFMREVVRLLASRPDKMDQDAYNTAISNWERRTAESLTFSIMDPARVSNGWVYFMRMLGQRSGADLVAVHNNWADGQGDGNTHVQKVHRFREHLLWMSDPDERYAKRRLYLTYEPLEGTVNVWEEVDRLKEALSIARVMGRALILPRMYCGGEDIVLADIDQDMYRCTVDSFLDVQALESGFPDGVFESSFPENDRVPLENIRPSAMLYMMNASEAKERTGSYADAIILTIKGAGGQVDEDELMYLRDKVNQIPLLTIKEFSHKFGGYEHPVNQLYLEKALRKGVRENHYVREAANRINIKHVASQCVALHVPSWCLEERDDCLSRLPLLFSKGPAAKLNKNCVFVVWLHKKRTKQHVEPIVSTLSAVFKRVWMVAEDYLEFPLSDLWRMGDHYMVVWIQQHLVLKLARYVYLVRRQGDLHRFDQEVKRALGEDRGQGSIEIDLSSKDPLLLPPPPSSCPSPKYGDNRMLKDVGHELQQQFRRLRLSSVCFEEATRMTPADVEAWQWLAAAYLSDEQLDKAAKAYERANELRPNAAILINMGVALQRQGKHEEAEEVVVKEDVVEEEEVEIEAYALQDLGRLGEARDSFTECIRVKPDFARAYAGLGSVLSNMGDLQKSVENFEQAVQHARGQFAAEQEVYKKMISELGEVALAYSYWATSILAAYQVSIGHRSYGKVPEDQIYIEQATKLFEKSIEVDPQCGMCHGQFGDMYKDAHKITKSIEHYTLSALYLPHVPTIFCNLVYTKLFACDWQNYHAEFDRLVKMVQEETDPRRPIPRHLCVQPLQAVLYRPLSAELMKQVAITYTNKVLSEEGTIQPIPIPSSVFIPAADGRLRVGYLSADFKDHPVAKRMQDVYGLHDRRRTRVTCYCLNANDGSKWRNKIESSVERFVDLHVVLAQEGTAGVASRIARDEVDVLINLAGHTRGNDAVTVVMARRPAPVQLMHEGYAGTMGGAEHTAHMTDRISSPPEYEGHYVEKLLYMPDCFFVNDHRQTYASLRDDVAVEGVEKARRLAYGSLPPDIPFLFGAFNQLHKIEPDIWDTWMEAMRNAPWAHLWLIKIHSRDAELNLKARARQLGVEEERVHVVQGYNEEEHLYVKAAADLFLDTPSYNAHSTGCDVLWSGTPLLTIPGDKMGSRVAASLNRAIGCEETTVRTEDEYAELAVALAKGKKGLRRRKECVRAGKRLAPLFDTGLWVRNQERALRMAAEVSFAHPHGSSGVPGDRKFHIVVSKRE
ncbi:UDP-N-acetylglucosamine-peptide N-acetylglucosaminyltransferase [Guillardia theta CCMP2712]|uniref:protein O-GlcNAc transferase n=3 Tax=Guillardia theta TaxID=55529 RepID=L1J8G7_GUITC|nr:UDP-N-acetylglucosamine-peptide N-acetylglucosaminyltransferase [Guillardia theta CCMP2712]EKX44399.1 UDP-N-acetylglucosamine-peptide N-acetylglucosaminyltransferase [Guillardia theta CCMP2712]|eukprot:XP_005831379.1 UDP-N-acetylglucosamine-peptide N-acetylglucosaminyltransferase [Guillardia theta CCMP2712]